jgi:DnaK suppressor protein
MDLPTQTHLTNLRDLLLFRQRELASAMHALERIRRDAPAPSGVQEVRDGKDDAELRQGAAIDEAQEQRDFQELAGVRAALQRLDEGTYGDCADCGEPIPLQRLMVQPAAARCAACQAAHEHREAARGAHASP